MTQVSQLALAFAPPPLDKMKRESTAVGASDVSTPRAKRAKRSVVAIKGIRIKDLNPLLSRICTKDDKPIENIDFKASVNLTGTKEEWIDTPFGIKDTLINTTELPSFMVGGSSKETWLSLALKVDYEMKNHINGIDAALLGKSSFEGEVHVSAKEFEDMFIMNVRVQLASSVVQTLITVVNDAGKHTGHGWEFLEPFMESHRNFKGGVCKICISPSFVWSRDKKKGVVWQVDRLVLKPGQNVIELEYDPFADVE
jgi:hypothetical protein